MYVSTPLTWAALLVLFGASLPLRAQESPLAAAPPGAAVELDSLIRLALATNPPLRAAESRARAADALVPVAGARPDPMLMVGVMNLPLGGMGFSDEMTMKAVSIGQTIPFPGKLGLATRAARHEAEAAWAELEAARRETVRAVKAAYYDVALADALLELVERDRDRLVAFIGTAEASYRVGRVGQEDVLRVRTEATRLAEDALALREQRRATLARLNALLNRPSFTPAGTPRIPERLVRLAVPDSAAGVRFQTSEFGARAADSPLPPLDSLQALAIAHSPMVMAHEERLAAQSSQVALARRAALPDFEVTLQYGQRNGLADMVTAMVAVPIPLQRGRKQAQALAAAESERAAEEAEHHAMVNELQARIAALHGELEQIRTRLALYAAAILPQSRATVEAAMSGFQVGRTGLSALLDAQATLFNIEAESLRALAAFAATLASLEAAVGTEVLP